MNLKFEPPDIIPVGVALSVIMADQLSKLWIMETFALHEERPVIQGLFSLVYVTNTGAAFGFLAGSRTWMRQAFFVGVAVAAIVIIILAYGHLKRQSRIFVYALGLIGGGAIGNLIDRLRLGSVVDFLDFYIGSHHWPAFNVADSAITVGVGLFLIGTLLQHRAQAEEAG